MFRRGRITKSEAQVIEQIERALERKLPLLDELDESSFGVVVQDEHVVALAAPGSGLEQLPENFGLLARLQIVNLKGCSLEELPDSIGDLARLRTLGLRGNRLTSLPASIGNLRELRALSVSENRLADLPDTIGDLLNLRELVLLDNCLVSLPSTIGGLKGVQLLVLARNKLESLPDEFGAMVSLKECYLSENKLTRIPAGIRSLGNLRKLVLDDNPLDESSIRLAKSLGSSGCVVSIRQSDGILSRMARIEENREAVLENPTTEQIFTGVKATFTLLIPYFEGVKATYEEDYRVSAVTLSNIRTSEEGIEAVVTFHSGYEEPGSTWNFSSRWDRVLFTASKWFILNVGTFTFRNSEMKDHARVSQSLDELNRLMGWDETIERIDKPLDSEYWGSVGVEYLKAGRFDEAEDALKKSVELAPESAPAWGRLVVFFNNRGRKDEALEAVENALRYAPASWPGTAVMEKYRQDLTS